MRIHAHSQAYIRVSCKHMVTPCMLTRDPSQPIQLSLKLCPGAGLAAGALVWTLTADMDSQEPPASSQDAQALPSPPPPPLAPAPHSPSPSPSPSPPAPSPGWQQQLQQLPALLLARVQGLALPFNRQAPAESPRSLPPPPAAQLSEPPPPFARQPRLPQAQADRAQQPQRLPQPPEGPQSEPRLSISAESAVGDSAGQDAPGSKVLWRRVAPSPVPRASGQGSGRQRQAAQQEARASVMDPPPMPRAAMQGNRPDGQVRATPYEVGRVDFWALPRTEASGSWAQQPSSSSTGGSSRARYRSSDAVRASQNGRQPDQRDRVPELTRTEVSTRQIVPEGVRNGFPQRQPQDSGAVPQNGKHSSAADRARRETQAAAGGARKSLSSGNSARSELSELQHHAQPQGGQDHLWDNVDSMDDDMISGIIEAAQRAGIRRRMWDN